MLAFHLLDGLHVRGQALSCGHFLAEEMPDETYALLRPFLLGEV
jgi:hypothetical protein